MDMIFGLLTCLLVLSFAAANQNWTNTTPATFGFNLTQLTTMPTLSNSTVPATVILNFTEEKMRKTSTKLDNERLTRTQATTESTSQTSPIKTISLKSSTPRTPTFTELTTQEIHTAAGYPSTLNTSGFQTDNSSHISNITTTVGNQTTAGLHLNISERNMTIIFGTVLGVFVVALVMFMFDKCKHKIQFVHQPLNRADDSDGFVAEDDTLVSGRLYDGHPIFDNVPPAPADLSQFHLELLQ